MSYPTIGQSVKDNLEAAAEWAFQQFMRPFQVYIEAGVANISTSPNYSRFGQHDQNVFDPAVNPQVMTINGTILYQNQQPYEYAEPQTRTSYEQNKLRESFGQVRLKVDASGYAALQGCKLVNVDGFNFKLTSNGRPHSMFGPPTRYNFYLTKVD